MFLLKIIRWKLPYFHIADTMKKSIFTKKTNFVFEKLLFDNSTFQWFNTTCIIFWRYFLKKYCSALKSFFFWKKVFNFLCKFDFFTFFLMALLDRSAKVSGCSPAKTNDIGNLLGWCFAHGPFTGPQIGVGWGGVWYHSSVLQDMMRCYASNRVGWGGLWYHSSVLQDMMRCYATHGVGWGVILFVSTARHDVMLRYAWGGVGCDIIRQYCKTWCDATLRMRWGGVWYHSSVLQDMMRCYATHGVGWGGLWYHSSVLQDMMRCYASHGVGVGWGVISFVSTARHDAVSMATGNWWKSQFQTAFVPKSKANAMVCCSSTFEVNNGDGKHTGFDLLTATGEAVRSLMRWREKATLFVRRVLQHKTL